MKNLIAILILFCSTSFAGEYTVMGGVSLFKEPANGTYWNNNQPHDNFMSPAAFALRYDESWWAIQYTHFGEVKVNGLAVLTDEPFPGGFIPGNSTCVGKCAPLRRWNIHSDTQSVAFIAQKKVGPWSFELGANLYEVKTSGDVYATDNYRLVNGQWVKIKGAFVYQYPEARYLDAMPMLGISYQSGPWSIHVQEWFMPAPGETPAAFNESGTTTILVGYTF